MYAIESLTQKHSSQRPFIHAHALFNNTTRWLFRRLGYRVLGKTPQNLPSFKTNQRTELEWVDFEQVQIPIPHLPPALEGFKIVQLSDFHLYPYIQLDFIQRAVNFANSLKPDLYVLTGDFVLDHAEAIFDLAPVLAQLNARYGIFSILGNHDIWTDHIRKLKQSTRPI